VPALHEPFGTSTLDLTDALVVAGLALVPAAGAEAAKALLRRRSS
jgi:hypothetical protein